MKGKRLLTTEEIEVIRLHAELALAVSNSPIEQSVESWKGEARKLAESILKLFGHCEGRLPRPKPRKGK